MKLRNALLASAMIALPMAAAQAQAIDGLYVGGGVGLNYLQPESFRASTAAGSVSGDAKANLGPAIVVSLGWGFGNGLRAEVEGSYRQNNGFNHPTTFANFGGQEQKAGAMVNVLYDFIGVVPVVQPYVGVGVGYQWAFEQNLHGSAAGSTFVAANSNKGSLAYQAILGAALPIVSVPGLAVTLEYRFMGLADERKYSASFVPGGAGNLTSTSNFNHSALIGVRYAFGAAPAPVVTPVADLGAKTFLVFFDWNKADLTSRSQGIVRDAAAYSTRTQYTRIDVDGNADTSGTPTYNQGLSERRARVVAAELVRDGVPQSAISMHAYGDTKLLVPTGPNTREPQNRRVEIVFH